MTEQELYTGSELLRNVAAGDEKAFRTIFHDYWDNIYGVALLLTKSATVSEDLVQEIFIKIWEQREKLPVVHDFKSYLFIVARNHIISSLRKKTLDVSFNEELVNYFSGPHSPEQQLLHKESRELISRAVERLPEQQRAVYNLYHEQGFSYEKIAETMGLSKNTVRNHMARANQSVRDYLSGHAEGLLLLICFIDLFLPY